MLNELAPMVEKLSDRLWFIEAIAVIIPINAIMPNAMMATVMPVRSLLLFTVRKASESESDNCMPNKLFIVRSIKSNRSEGTISKQSVHYHSCKYLDNVGT